MVVWHLQEGPSGMWLCVEHVSYQAEVSELSYLSIHVDVIQGGFLRNSKLSLK